uniref:Target of myb1 like 2 membrane trafficking protein n=1 Tax=Neogobius melanostomus TaxID=47308 RepID=A0A8C6U119_9GOBI
MEFLLGNPFSTPAGHCIERATDGSLQSEDWTLNMEICDIINETEDGPKDAIRAVKKRLNGNKNYREVMLTLTVLETCVKNCGHRFHAMVTSRDFIDGVLVKIISPKNNPPTIVQDKVLALIQAWADAFRSSPDLTGVVQIYEEMKRKGIEFPNSELETLSPIQTPQRVSPLTNERTFMKKLDILKSPISNVFQICRLRSELDIVRGNTKVMSEMLTEMVPGQEDASDYELLQELNRTCRVMQQRIMELISCVSNESVTEELLHVNDDLNNIFLRYERYERFRSGRSTAQSVNNGVLSEATEDNLIDLGPGSPAVVSNLPSSPATLASRLAGLGKERHPSNLLEEKKKQAGRACLLSWRAYFRLLNFTQILFEFLFRGVVSQSSVMDDIEEWLSTDVKGDDGEEGVTSEEFDKFLEERAKAAEMTPGMPSPPTGDPGAPQQQQDTRAGIYFFILIESLSRTIELQ